MAPRNQIGRSTMRNRPTARRAEVKHVSQVSAQLIQAATASRFSPLRNLSPDRLIWEIEMFEAGDFTLLGRTMDIMQNRDHTWKIAAAKTRKDTSRRQWQCSPLDGYTDDPEAADQSAILKEFYSAIKVTDYKCQNIVKGVNGLVGNIMRAYNDLYNVQEIVFEPSPSGKLSARVMRCPLEWFRLRDGLMHLVADSSTGPLPLEPGGWLIAQGDGVGVASAVAYQFKRMALGDLAIYSGRCGQPGIQGKTDAEYGTPGWTNMAKAVKNFGREFAAVTGLNDILEKIDLSFSGQLPQPIIIEMMDRAISALQRGADLSTMSAGDGSGEGASLQGGESVLITADNCEMVTEVCRYQLDPLVIAWHYGEDAEIKAGFELIPPKRENVEIDLKIDQALTGMGAKLSKNDALERYSRREVKPDDKDDSPLTAPVTAEGILADNSFANEAHTSKRSPAPAAGTNTPADRSGSPGIHDPAAAILNRAAATILDGSTPFDQAMAAAIAELEKLPAAAADLPDTFEKKLTEAMFTAAANNIQETA